VKVEAATISKMELLFGVLDQGYVLGLVCARLWALMIRPGWAIAREPAHRSALSWG
jgi:hypothetical protein